MEDGYGCIDQISPPNSEVRKLIENRDRYAIPPSLVVRHFTFLNEIPKGYAYLLPPNSQNLPKGRYFFRVDLDFDKFLDLAAREDLVTDRQPEPEIDESTVSDEDWLAAQRNKRK